ncbi:MAG: lytic transglycosylase domain-containing protein [Pseudomonadota bacterium]
MRSLLFILAALCCAAPAFAQSGAHSAPIIKPNVNAASSQIERVLSAGDVQLYRDIFALQADGKFTAADKHIKRLNDRLLMGHVLLQRYLHPTAYRSRYSELRKWMAAYADHPGAKRIYRLAVKRRGNAGYPKRPVASKRKGRSEEAAKQFRDRRSNASIKRSIARDIRNDRLTLAGSRILTEYEKKRLSHTDVGLLSEALNRAWIAWGTPEKGLAALESAAPIARPARITTDWRAALAAWKLGDYEVAQTHFSAVLTSSQYDDLAAAGGVWAARSAYRSGRVDAVSALLRASYAAAPDSFYGLIAARQLGIEILRDWSPPILTPRAWKAIRAHRGVRRAVALSQVGQSNLADAELLAGWYRADNADYQAYLALAYSLDLPQAQLRIAESAPKGEKAPLLNLYPIPSWQPLDGFQTDPAMLFALIRQESRFAARARSRSGARGLMQVMPRTAGYIGRDRRLIRDKQNMLYDAEFNMSLGQRYVNYLKGHKSTDGDLLYLLAAYNGGPGNVNKWRRNIDSGDPLWFIEHIPLRETRAYVEQVSANYWIYRTAMGLETTTLDRLAAGLWPAIESDSPDALKQMAMPQNTQVSANAYR